MAAALHIEIPNDIDFEVYDNSILFKNDDEKYELKIDEKFCIQEIKTKHDLIDGKEKIKIKIADKKIQPPSLIPKLYGNLTPSACGLYSVERLDYYQEKNINWGQNKKFYYFDPSIVDEEKYRKFANKYGLYENIKLPEPFWISSQYREIGYEDRSFLGVFRYSREFDPLNNTMLLEANELFSLIYEALSQKEDLLKAFPHGKINIGSSSIYINYCLFPLDNWDIPFVYNNNYYKINSHILEEKCIRRIDFKEQNSYWVMPVIKVKKYDFKK